MRRYFISTKIKMSHYKIVRHIHICTYIFLFLSLYKTTEKGERPGILFNNIQSREITVSYPPQQRFMVGSRKLDYRR